MIVCAAPLGNHDFVPIHEIHVVVSEHERMEEKGPHQFDSGVKYNCTTNAYCQHHQNGRH